LTNQISDSTKMRLVKILTGWFYWKMVWRKKNAWAIIEESANKITSGLYQEESEINQTIYHICKGG